MQRSADAAPAHGATDPAAAPASRLRAKRARRRSAAPSACAAHAPTQPQRDAAAKPLECLPCARTLDRVARRCIADAFLEPRERRPAAPARSPCGERPPAPLLDGDHDSRQREGDGACDAPQELEHSWQFRTYSPVALDVLSSQSLTMTRV